MNPFHHIPVLVDDGINIVESLAILDYLEAKYPQPSLLPTDPTDIAKVRMVEMVTVNELCPAMIPLYPKILGLGEGDSTQVAESEKKITTVLQFLEGLLDDRPFFGNDTITLAEPVAGTVIPYLAATNLTLDPFPKLQAWIDRLVQRPAWTATQASAAAMATFRKIMAERFAQSA
jgi:glutathione S-transferase